MELTHRFSVPASVDVTWEAFNDLERVVPCFPGAALTAYDGESFDGLVKVKLGPISMQYTGTGRFVERDATTYRAVIEAKGKDKRGNGTAAAKVTASLKSAGADSTDVLVQTDLNVTGKPAQFGRGVMQDVSDKLLAQFSTCLSTRLGTSASDEAAAASHAAPATEAAAHQAFVAAGPDAGAQPPAKHRADTSADTPPTVQSTPEPIELNLGTAVLPVLLKHYAPFLVGGAAALWLLRRLSRRRS